MKVRFYGHNCFIIEAAGKRILTDPWFRPAWYTWYPFPINRRFRSELLCEKDDIDYLYVSHPHPDHFDELFLAEFRKDVGVLCPNYKSKKMQRKFSQLGFTNLIESEGGALHDGLHFQIIRDNSPLKEDSALYLQVLLSNAKSASFLNLNDCFIDYDRLPRGVTFLASQFSTAIHYPHAYDFPEELKHKKILDMQRTNFEHCLRTITTVSPKFYIPSSGPPRFLDPALWSLNKSDASVFYDFNFVRDNFRRLTSISSLELDPGDMFADGEITKGSIAEDRDIVAWSKQLDTEWRAIYTDPEEYSDAELEQYFASIKANNARFVTRFPRRFKLVVLSNSGQRGYVIVLDDLTDYVISPKPKEEIYNYTFTVPAQLIRKILYEEWDWADVFITMMAVMHRDEDYYDQALFQLLNFGHQPEILNGVLEKLESNVDMIEKGPFLIQRLCPHAGHDLMYAALEGNVLTCPRHRWKWDLNTGQCLRGGNTPIKVQRKPTL
jgi:UDP-MurNAc hydroxylase